MSILVARLRALHAVAGLTRAFIGYALFGVVELAIWVAVVLFAYDRGGPSLVAVASVAQLLPAVVLAAPLGAIGDRMPRGTALVVAHAGVALTTALTGAAITLGAPVGVVVAAAATATTAVAVVRPVYFAALPQLTRTPDQLVAANSLSSVADGAALFAGPALAGVGAATTGPVLVFAVAAATSAVAALLCLGLRLVPAEVNLVEEPTGAAGLTALVRGLQVVGRDPGLLALLLVMATDFLIAGALDVLATTYAQEVLGRGRAGAGVLIGGIGIGALAGAGAAGWLGRRRRLSTVVLGGGVLQGVAVALAATFATLPAAIAAVALTGAGGAVLTVAGRTLLQRVVEERVLARVFAVQEGSALFGLALGAAAAPALISTFSPAGAFVPLGLGAALFTLATTGLLRRLDAGASRRASDARPMHAAVPRTVTPPRQSQRAAPAALTVSLVEEQQPSWDGLIRGS